MAENEVTVRLEGGKARAKREEDEDESPDLSAAPLFAELDPGARETLDHVIVERLHPVREGSLGKFEPDVTEETIFDRCGGGKYRLQARTAKGKPIKGAFVTVEIAGEPIFQSELAQRQYDRMKGGLRALSGGNTPAPAQSFSPQDFVALLASSGDKAEADRARREEEAESRHRRDLERLEREAKAREEERERADARQKRYDDERDERRKREDEAARERDRQFQATLLAMTKSNAPAPAADPVAMLLAGVKLASSIGGGGGGGEGPADPLMALASNLPQTVKELGQVFRGANPATPGAAGGPNEPLQFVGALGEKGKAVVKHLQAQGLDPAAILDQAFNALLQMRRTDAPAAVAAASSTTPAAPRRGPGGRPMAPSPRAPAQSVQPPARTAQPAAQPAPAPAAAAEPPPVEDVQAGDAG